LHKNNYLFIKNKAAFFHAFCFERQQITVFSRVLVSRLKWTDVFLVSMEGLVMSRAACRAISPRRRTTAHITISSSVLCTGYVVNKTVSCVPMNMILMTIIK
jgi:hypothetical protein